MDSHQHQKKKSNMYACSMIASNLQSLLKEPQSKRDIIKRDLIRNSVLLYKGLIPKPEKSSGLHLLKEVVLKDDEVLISKIEAAEGSGEFRPVFEHIENLDGNQRRMWAYHANITEYLKEVIQSEDTNEKKVVRMQAGIYKHCESVSSRCLELLGQEELDRSSLQSGAFVMQLGAVALYREGPTLDDLWQAMSKLGDTLVRLIDDSDIEFNWKTFRMVENSVMYFRNDWTPVGKLPEKNLEKSRAVLKEFSLHFDPLIQGYMSKIKDKDGKSGVEFLYMFINDILLENLRLEVVALEGRLETKKQKLC